MFILATNNDPVMSQTPAKIVTHERTAQKLSDTTSFAVNLSTRRSGFVIVHSYSNQHRHRLNESVCEVKTARELDFERTSLFRLKQGHMHTSYSSLQTAQIGNALP